LSSLIPVGIIRHFDTAITFMCGWRRFAANRESPNARQKASGYETMVDHAVSNLHDSVISRTMREPKPQKSEEASPRQSDFSVSRTLLNWNVLGY
jgi:hypothetical protein